MKRTDLIPAPQRMNPRDFSDLYSRWESRTCSKISDPLELNTHKGIEKESDCFPIMAFVSIKSYQFSSLTFIVASCSGQS